MPFSWQQHTVKFHFGRDRDAQRADSRWTGFQAPVLLQTPPPTDSSRGTTGDQAQQPLPGILDPARTHGFSRARPCTWGREGQTEQTVSHLPCSHWRAHRLAFSRHRTHHSGGGDSQERAVPLAHMGTPQGRPASLLLVPSSPRTPPQGHPVNCTPQVGASSAPLQTC